MEYVECAEKYNAYYYYNINDYNIKKMDYDIGCYKLNVCYVMFVVCYVCLLVTYLPTYHLSRY